MLTRRARFLRQAKASGLSTSAPAVRRSLPANSDRKRPVLWIDRPWSLPLSLFQGPLNGRCHHDARRTRSSQRASVYELTALCQISRILLKNSVSTAPESRPREAVNECWHTTGNDGARRSGRLARFGSVPRIAWLWRRSGPGSPVIPGAGRPRRKSGSHRTPRWREADSNHRCLSYDQCPNDLKRRQSFGRTGVVACSRRPSSSHGSVNLVASGHPFEGIRTC
jgi:hypothetical protein